MKRPLVKLTYTLGTITIELYPDIAPNAVKSFLYLAENNIFTHHPIERIVPQWVVDMSYHGFYHPKACYFIENDLATGNYLPAEFGTIGLGGYGDPEIAGGEFFFPLRDCPEITGVYPIFGKIIEGLDVLRQIENTPTYPVPYPTLEEVKINTPIIPIYLENVEIETFGIQYGEPKKIKGKTKPLFWPTITE